MTVATLGDINIDVTLTVDHLPSRGEEVFATRRIENLGGSAANTAVVLARLGVESIVMGAVGDDDAGHRALYLLGSADVDVSQTSLSETHPTAMNTVLVTPDGERTMIGARGANVTYKADEDWHNGVDWLHVSGYALMEGDQRESALSALMTARRAGIPTSLDMPLGVGARLRDLDSDPLAGHEILSASRAALREITGNDEPLETVTSVGTLAITAGADPVIVSRRDDQVVLRPPPIDPVDVTGAGDAFMAGLIAARLLGFDLGPSSVLATAAGAAATLVSGAYEAGSSPEIWSRVLHPDAWQDVPAEWLDDVRSIIGCQSNCRSQQS